MFEIDNEKLLALSHALREGQTILIEGLWNAPKAYIASLVQQVTGKHVVILTGANQEEARLFNDFAFFSDRPVIDFPAWETLPSDHISPSPDVVGERYRVLRQIATSTQPHIILTNLQACLQCVIPKEQLNTLHITLKQGESYPFERLIERLSALGYRRQSIAADKGEFAVRGGIIDIFPVSTPEPYRIEFWGDEIDTIRIYDPIGQKSVLTSDTVEIPPAQELEILQKAQQTATLFDYLGPDTVVILDDLLALEDRYAELISLGGTASHTFRNSDMLFDQIKPLQKMYWSQQSIHELSQVQLEDKLVGSYYSEKAPLYKLKFEMFNHQLEAHQWRHPFILVKDFLLPEASDEEEPSGNDILQALNKVSGTDIKLHVLCASESEETYLQERLNGAGIRLPKHTTQHLGYLSSGFAVRESNLLLLPMTEITRRYKIRRQKQRSTYHTISSESYELAPGEMIVHLNHGIGRFLGIEKKPNNEGNIQEFFKIEYANQASLYVPLNQAYLITKYIGAEDEIPKMHTLGTAYWKRTRERTEKAILDYAKDLLELYAHRSIKQGFAYSPDSPELSAFEEDFPFVETEDQLAAISSVKQDMVSPNVMDRLVCGDVGYGKTEVAMRAAFKAVVDGKKQVAVLVPTTVLAMQHFENFQERMSQFPINIAVLSRFQSVKEVRETIEKVAAGKVDILIGTHRIISDDVFFKDLGLVIIDEEQRFGVKAKEHLKKLKLNVDCLTLSATPIPRTMYMSLIGVRDMSVISTPPQDRLPISTFITEPHDQVIKTALLRELSRDGQAFVIHNRVETIYDFADRLKKLLPQARILVGHGQMHGDEIDQVFHAFKQGRADILVSTTIIENGIDIPNANTILIDRADRFGMADLYQLRGRVGRWNRRAYAYFLVPSLTRLPEISRKRLDALMEASGYGGGMKLARRDLEIRGAGNLLGTQQSGHVSAIGFHLYCKMLKRAVQQLQGKKVKSLSDVKVDAYFNARLPEEYVNEVSLRMEIYQRLGEAISWEEVDALWDEIRDRFGPPPEPAQWLYHLTRIKVYAAEKGITAIKIDTLSLSVEREKGKNTEIKKYLLGKIKSPAEMEQKVVGYL